MLHCSQQQSRAVCMGVEMGLYNPQDQGQECISINPQTTTWLLLESRCHHPRPRQSLLSF